MTEKDPNGIDSHTPGAKLDNGKVMASLLEGFGLALLAVAEVGTFGAKKYSRNGWEEVKDGKRRYRDAKWRHLLKGHLCDYDKDSKLLHKAHEAWNILAELEFTLREGKSVKKEERE